MAIHSDSPPPVIRAATRADVTAIDGLIRELAAYVQEPDAVEAGVEDLEAALFGPDPRVHALVAEVVGDDGVCRTAGIAVWFVTYSTWTGRHGIWLEDLYVQPVHRGLGLGRRLLATLAQECLARGYRRLEWAVLDWNEGAAGFYRSIGAHPHDDMTTWRLADASLRELGGSAHIRGAGADGGV